MSQCFSCKSVHVEIAYTDDDSRGYCDKCFGARPTIPSEFVGLLYLMYTIPFKVGDRVECRTAGYLYDGIGTVQEVSLDPANGGTPVYPAFRVQLEEKAENYLPDDLWYVENCLTLSGDPDD
jgi:hypothetical protein